MEGLEFLFTFLAGNVTALGNLLHWLSDRFHDMNKTAAASFNFAAGLAHGLGLDSLSDELRTTAKQVNDFADKDAPYAEESAKKLGDAYAGMADQVAATNRQLKSFLDLEEQTINLSLDLDNAVLAMSQGWLDLNSNLIKGKGNWSDNTEAGIKNQQMLNDQISKIDAVRRAEIAKSDGSVESINKINAEYDKNLAKLLKVAQAAGDSKAALEALAKAYYLDVIVSVAEIGARNQQIKAKAVDNALGNLLGFASGGTVPGPVGSSHLALVHGKERVLTPPQAAAMDKATVAGDGATMQLIFGGNLDSAFATAVMKMIRSGDITISSKAIV